MSGLKEFWKRAELNSDNERDLDLYGVIEYIHNQGIGVGEELTYQKFVELYNKLRKVLYV